MSRKIVNFNIEDFGSEDICNTAADAVEEGHLVIVRGVFALGVVESLKSRFDYAVYDINAAWDEDLGEFEEEALRDGGICELGDARDAINHFLEMLRDEEHRG